MNIFVTLLIIETFYGILPPYSFLFSIAEQGYAPSNAHSSQVK